MGANCEKYNTHTYHTHHSQNDMNVLTLGAALDVPCG